MIGLRGFRLLGWTVRYQNHRLRPPYWPERYGGQRVLHIGPHCFAVFRREAHHA